MSLTYEQKLQIADDYLHRKCWLGWNSLPDINSLHNCEDIDDIHIACDERLSEDDFPED